MKLVHAGWVCPVAGPPLADAAVAIDDGRIVEVIARGGFRAADAEVSFPNCALVPGFVNAHTHLELTVLRGFLEDLPFEEWLRRLTRTKYDLLSVDDLLVSARLGALECLAGGVTTVGEVMDIGTGCVAMRELGLGGVAYQEVFGPATDQADEAMERLEERLARLRPDETPAIRIGLSPHAPYTVSTSLYGRVRDLAQVENLPVAVHIAESGEEVRFVRDGAGPFAENWRARGIPVTAHGVGPLELLERLGILGPRTLAVHAIHADSADVARLAATGTAVVHCPKSNLKLGHGVAPVREFLAADVPVGLGTDSVASNNSVDMFEEMRLAVYLQRSRTGDPEAIGAARALRMATLDGARCLGLDSMLGSLEPGKRADFAVVDLEDCALTPVHDPVQALVYSAGRRNVEATYVAGERVEIDPGPTMAEANRIARRLRTHR